MKKIVKNLWRKKQMKVKGVPLFVTYKHIDYVNDKTGEEVHRTVARSIVDYYNLPKIIATTFMDMFANTSDMFGDRAVELVAETACKGGDTYDEVTGEKIARKKIMKKYMSLVSQASAKKIADNNKEIELLNDLEHSAVRCESDIIDYLRKQ